MSETRLRAVFSSVAQGAELSLDGFIEAIVRLAFYRANPSSHPSVAPSHSADAAGASAAALAAPQPNAPQQPQQPQQPLPGCLARLLREHLLAAAKQDRP